MVFGMNAVKANVNPVLHQEWLSYGAYRGGIPVRWAALLWRGADRLYVNVVTIMILGMLKVAIMTMILFLLVKNVE